jgi:hypothetical protein
LQFARKSARFDDLRIAHASSPGLATPRQGLCRLPRHGGGLSPIFHAPQTTRSELTMKSILAGALGMI